MIKYLLILNLLFVFACSRPTPKQTFPIPSKNDINEIVKAVILHDSLTEAGVPLSVDLEKKLVYTPKSRSYPPPEDPLSLNVNGRPISDIIDSINGSDRLNAQDSLYILFQNDILTTFKIEPIFSKNLKYTSKLQQKNDYEKGKSFNFYEISIPIFSLDQQKVFVELTHFCSRWCVESKTIILKKTNGKWTISHILLASVS